MIPELWYYALATNIVSAVMSIVFLHISRQMIEGLRTQMLMFLITGSYAVAFSFILIVFMLFRIPVTDYLWSVGVLVFIASGVMLTISTDQTHALLSELQERKKVRDHHREDT